MKRLLETIDHRPYPYPRSAWVMTQSWDELLFMHWSVEPSVMRALVPLGLELDLFEERAWIGVVPFKMNHVRPRFTPSVPLLSFFLELNVRTYVKVNGVAGVYFFSLDCSNALAVESARVWFGLPYYLAEMRAFNVDGWTNYKSMRCDRRGEIAEIDVRYRPVGDPYRSIPGTLEHFLTERYCLYTTCGDHIARGHVHHEPWNLQSVESEIRINTMLSPLGINLPGSSNPIMHYSKELLTVEWAPEAVTSI